MWKKKQWICSFIVLFILILGMWVDEVKADSTFLFPKTQTFSMKKMSSAVLSDIDIESTEILCTYNVISSRQISAHLIHSKRVIKLSMVFLCRAIFAFLLSNFYTTAQVMDYPIQDTQTVVLNYIHNTDGKKEFAFVC